MKQSDRIQVLLEDMNGKFDLIMEYVRDIPDIKTRLTNLEKRMDKNDQDHEVMLALLKVDGRDIAQLKHIHPNMQHS
jgi:hypothetical protein